MVRGIVPKWRKHAFLKAWREYRGLTQAQLGDLLGVGPPQISNWETGKRAVSYNVHLALAEALRVNPEDLFRDPNTPSADALLRDAPVDVQQQALAYIRFLITQH
jgi:transcriptional regulator with XRE-family HTH domain